MYDALIDEVADILPDLKSYEQDRLMHLIDNQEFEEALMYLNLISKRRAR